MSLRVVLGTSLALILVSPNWTAAAVPKAKNSSVTSDRNASVARPARKEAASEERSRKEKAQKEASQKEPARKGRAGKEAAQKEPAQKRRAEKETTPKEAGRKGRAQKEASQKEEARKERAQKEASLKKDTKKERAGKEASQKKETRKERAQKEAAEKEEAREERAEKAAAQKKREQQERAQNERIQKEKERAQEAQAAYAETVAALRLKLRDLRRQVGELEAIRAELAAVKAQVRGNQPKPLIWGGMPLTLPPSLGTRSIDNPEIELAALQTPSAREADPGEPQPPVDPAIAALRAVIREQLQALAPPKSAVEEAKTYLVKTATPGYTMTRQSPEVAIDRLHPGFAVKLAQAIRRAREEGMTQAGVFSAYRPPAFGIGGFRNKFDSLHSYGLATDITGIGRPGSETAHRWQEIVQEVGLYLPYGADHRVEFNHTQFIPPRIAPRELRDTITADGPKDLREMWLASGVDAHVPETPAVAVASAPVKPASTDAASAEPTGPE